jgi:phosphohistidine swiveling domain-containing protein
MKEKWKKFANEYVVSLFPVFMLANAFASGMKKFLGKSADILLKIENHAIEYYNLPSNWQAAHLNLVKIIKNKPAFLRQNYSLMEKLGKKQIVETAALKANLKNKSNKVINNYYQRYVESNTNFYVYGLILPLLDFQDSTFLSDELNRIIKIRRKEKYFGILTTPLRDTFNKLQELNLWKILIIIQKNKKLVDNFKNLNSKEILEYLKANYLKILRLLEKHAAKYTWVNYVYEGPAMNIGDFIDIICDLIKRKINPKQELADHEKERLKLILAQKKIMRELEVNRYEKEIIELARDAVFYKPYRRELQTCSYYQMEFLLNEIAARLHLSLQQVRMMLPQEIASGLLKGKVDTDLINQRTNLVIYGAHGDKNFCLTADKAREFIKNNIAKEAKVKLPKEIIGAVAFRGKATGKVTLINMPEEMAKMSDGDILVSAATSPNLMPAIRKAAAIVTDEGGLTCHAAIVSRELKIPCVTGTKIATKVLKDGDLVEVDADKGIVKKI